MPLEFALKTSGTGGKERIEIGDLGCVLLVVRVSAADLHVELRHDVVRQAGKSGSLLVVGVDDGLLDQAEQGAGRNRDTVQILVDFAVFMCEIGAGLPLEEIRGGRREPYLLREFSQIDVIVEERPRGWNGAEQRSRVAAVDRRRVIHRLGVQDAETGARHDAHRP